MSGDSVRLLVVDPAAGGHRDGDFAELVDLLGPGDLLVVNDAATLPASIAGVTADGAPVEVRLLGPGRGRRFPAVLFGAGDHRIRTEERPPPPHLAVGAALALGGQRALRARIAAVSPRSPRLVDLHFDRDGDAADAATATDAEADTGAASDRFWAALYAAGRPVQYAYEPAPLPLWSVQTVYGGRPWAAEMPSAGRPLSWELLLGLRRRGVAIAWLTHAAGLSSTGDPALDATLPLPEPYDIPDSTVRAVAAARRRGGRVVAVGTTVVRALEGAAASHRGRLIAGPGTTDLVIDARHRLRIVDGILSGVHAPDESHHRLLAAFADGATLATATAHALASGYRLHERGDATLVLPGSLSLSATGPARAGAGAG